MTYDKSARIIAGKPYVRETTRWPGHTRVNYYEVEHLFIAILHSKTLIQPEYVLKLLGFEYGIMFKPPRGDAGLVIKTELIGQIVSFDLPSQLIQITESAEYMNRNHGATRRTSITIALAYVLNLLINQSTVSFGGLLMVNGEINLLEHKYICVENRLACIVLYMYHRELVLYIKPFPCFQVEESHKSYLYNSYCFRLFSLHCL